MFFSLHSRMKKRSCCYLRSYLTWLPQSADLPDDVIFIQADGSAGRRRQTERETIAYPEAGVEQSADWSKTCEAENSFCRKGSNPDPGAVCPRHPGVEYASCRGVSTKERCPNSTRSEMAVCRIVDELLRVIDLLKTQESGPAASSWSDPAWRPLSILRVLRKTKDACMSECRLAELRIQLAGGQEWQPLPAGMFCLNEASVVYSPSRSSSISVAVRGGGFCSRSDELVSTPCCPVTGWSRAATGISLHFHAAVYRPGLSDTTDAGDLLSALFPDCVRSCDWSSKEPEEEDTSHCQPFRACVFPAAMTRVSTSYHHFDDSHSNSHIPWTFMNDKNLKHI
ncbi:uncharacterized protein LOC118302538 isoform X2 [Scophthalmus maximus]|uniref:uncharacterized protein LOC118302538 isoform X2 n=1 Tax=Scophthalmus maximus TaxID=52904 RepID=UPI0015E0A47A|nr:uncharacterized protein LOC118302538 isoform X2 [Scophthalmus maximus]XP_047187606.1 uncharacterized protein LOC118302538 isoform X2 [Scophthalmus maximus]XP_047187607.1 uncharacterized protein LOC118302538 isoform X2 [Scophthalmus maximus]XP_047187608.1 uncharacterized protein LOC118302538 isoform X2 [Scophthalmus maximus]